MLKVVPKRLMCLQQDSQFPAKIWADKIPLLNYICSRQNRLQQLSWIPLLTIYVTTTLSLLQPVFFFFFFLFIMGYSYSCYFHCPLLRFAVTFVITTLLVGYVGAHSSSRNYNPCSFPAIFNFGDSNSDTGGASALFRQFGQPEGQTYFGAPAGRYSDGRLVIDFIGMEFYSVLQNLPSEENILV